MNPSTHQRYTQKLTQLTADSFKPTLHNNQWRKPAISALQRSKLKQFAHNNNMEWQYNKPHKPAKPVIFKGHKYMLAREAQRLRVIDGLATQPERLQQYYESNQKSRVRRNDLLAAFTNNKITLYQTEIKQRSYELKPITDPKYMSKTPLTQQQRLQMKHKHLSTTQNTTDVQQTIPNTKSTKK